MAVYHYTVPDRLLSIIARGLDLATVGLEERERPAVWFTTSEDYEPTARKGLLDEATGDSRTLSLKAMIVMSGLARVEVEPEAAPLTWAAWRHGSGARSRVIKGLAASARELGSDIRLWRASFDPIPQDRIIGMDVWHEGAWMRVAERTTGGSLNVLVGPGSPFLAPSKVGAGPSCLPGKCRRSDRR